MKANTSQSTEAAREIDIALLRKELGMEGQENKGEFKVTVPQNDLEVSVDGFRIIPPMGLGSWVAFAPGSGQIMLMGILLLQNQI